MMNLLLAASAENVATLQPSLVPEVNLHIMGKVKVKMNAIQGFLT